MRFKNKLIEHLKISYPIIQGPMSGASPPALVAAVSNAGGLGSLGAAQMTPAQMRNAIKEIRALTEKPFAVNLFVPDEIVPIAEERLNHANKVLNPLRCMLGIPESPEFTSPSLSFTEQLEVIFEEKIPIFSFTFGIMPPDIIHKLKNNNTIVMGTATTCQEAKRLESAGVDFVIAQGSESGGHRGSAADTPIENALIGSMALIPQIVDQVKIPVIAAGGIMDGRGIVAALALGASAVQMGTAFLTCPEAGIHAKYREALLNANDESTCITRAFTGRYARGIKNYFITAMIKHQADILPHPLQRTLTRDIVAAAKQQNNPEFMMLWSGQAASLCRTKSASVLVAELMVEVKKILNAII